MTIKRILEIIRGILIIVVPTVDGLYLLGLAGTLECGGDIGSLAGRLVIALAVLIVYAVIVRAWAKKIMEEDRND